MTGSSVMRRSSSLYRVGTVAVRPIAVTQEKRVVRRKAVIRSTLQVCTPSRWLFCRWDYRIDPSDRVVVDFGSNIGISALYFHFLTHAPESFVYCFEPLPLNCERLKRTLKNYADRYYLSATAVAPYEGKANFSYEATGRYGSIGTKFPQQLLRLV